MNVKFKVKKLILALILCIMTFVPLCSFHSIQSEAIGDVNVQIGTDGKLNITGSEMNITSSTGAWNKILEKYRGFIVGVSGIGAISMIAFFIFNFMKLGAVSTNPQERSKVIQGLIWSGLAAAGLGAVAMIVGIFYSALK